MVNESKVPLAELRNAHKSYGPVHALSGCNLQIHPGEVVAMLGPNGAGKTTAVNLMMGLLKPDEGQAQLFGVAPRHARARIRTGVMLQVSGVPDTLRVKEHIKLFSSYYPNPMPLERVLAVSGLKGLENRSFGKLSGGQKQRLLFGLAICGRPELVFLDEPTVGLDVEARRAMWDEIKDLVQHGTSVALTTHYLEEADFLADRIVILNKGKIIAEGSPEQIKTLAAKKCIRCYTSLNATQLAVLPGVVSVREHRHGVEILTAMAEETLKLMFTKDPGLSQLEIVGAGLEEAFLNLTQDNDTEVAA